MSLLQSYKTTTTDSKSIANLFNKHFTSIDENVEQNIIASKSKYSDYFKNPCQQTFFFIPTNEQEALKTIKFLRRNKTSEPFSIPIKFLKLFQKELSKPISLIIDLSFLTGTFPVKLKIAKINSFFKNEDPSHFANYRSISLLSNRRKIVEILVHKHVSNFLTE